MGHRGFSQTCRRGVGDPIGPPGSWIPRALQGKLPLGLILLSMGCGSEPRAPLGEPPVPFAVELQGALERALQDGPARDILGLSAAVSVPGFETWAGVAGWSHRDVPISPVTLFDVGSVAKNLEASLALVLAEEKALGLDDPISTWLTPLRNVDGSITVRQLLNHTSGVFNVFENPAFPWVGTDVDYTREWSLEEAVSSFVLDPYGPPGSVQHYSSTNYRLLTTILEEVTGRPVPQEVEERFLVPLGLLHSWMTMGPLPPDRLSVAHPWADLDRDGEMEDLGEFSRTWVASLTHPVLFTTPTDLVGWLEALYRDRTVLDPSSLDAMLELPRVDALDPEGGRYGLGVVDFSETLGANVVGHAGSALGFSAAALYFPDHGVALAWAINTGESPADLAGAFMGRVWEGLSGVLFAHLEGRGG